MKMSKIRIWIIMIKYDNMCLMLNLDFKINIIINDYKIK
jgi:hypothetical protein